MTNAVAEAAIQILERTASAGDEGEWSIGAWRELAAGGFTEIGVDEELGGSGGDLEDAASVIAVTSKFAASVPLVEHMLGALWLKGLCGSQMEAGPTTVSTHDCEVQFTGKADGGGVVDGVLSGVPWARVASDVLFPVGQSGGLERFCYVEPDECEVVHRSNLAAEPRDDVKITSLTVPSDRILTLPRGAMHGLRLRIMLGRTIQMAAAIEEVLALTLRYCTEREQFGRPIGRFQAVQHDVANLAGEAVAASSASGAAVIALVRSGPASIPDERARASVESAWLRAGDAATKACRIAHQLHGAMGFTQEHRLHHLTTRLWSWRDEPESASTVSQSLGDRLADAGPDQLWNLLSAGQ